MPWFFTVTVTVTVPPTVNEVLLKDNVCGIRSGCVAACTLFAKARASPTTRKILRSGRRPDMADLSVRDDPNVELLFAPDLVVCMCGLHDLPFQDLNSSLCTSIARCSARTVRIARVEVLRYPIGQRQFLI